MFEFDRKLMWRDNRIGLHVTGDPENLGSAVGISILSVIEQELQVLPVCVPASLSSGVGRCRRVSATSSLRWTTPKTYV